MSDTLDTLTALLATADDADKRIGQPIRDALAAAEQNASGQVTAITARQGVRFTAANRAIRSVEYALLQRHPRPRGIVLAPDVDVPADFGADSRVATTVLLGLVRITALAPGAYGNTIEAAIVQDSQAGGLVCNVRRGAFFTETIARLPPVLGTAVGSGLLARLDTIGSGTVSVTAWVPLAGGGGGAEQSLYARMQSVLSSKVALDKDLAGSIDLHSREWRAPLANLTAAAMEATQASLDAATARAQAFIDYLAFT